jgi:hypothetical protein
MDKLIENLIADFKARKLPDLTRREQTMAFLRGKASAVIGMRRAGKTWFCFQQIEGLLAGGLEPDRVLYLSFGDERLQPMRQVDLERITEVFYRLFPQNKKRTCHFFFDEIQSVPGWDLFVRRVMDSEDAQVTLTGSSAKLLSREIATSLRGRALATEIFPFSFGEYLSHLGDEAPAEPFSSEARARLANRLEGYLQEGGFPEVVGTDPALRVQVLQDYVDVVIFRDVVERHGVSNTTALRHMVRHLLNAPAARFSVNKFYNSLRSQGVRCGRDVLHEWLDHLSDAFLIFLLRVDSPSEAVRRVNPPKVYAIDPGLIEAVRHRPAPDRGALLENMVFLAMRRRDIPVHYYLTASGYEVDFLARPSGGEARLVQVCAQPDEEPARARELRALTEAMTETGARTSTVVSMFHEETIRSDVGTIEIVPAWRWLLTDPLAAALKR